MNSLAYACRVCFLSFSTKNRFKKKKRNQNKAIYCQLCKLIVRGKTIEDNFSLKSLLRP